MKIVLLAGGLGTRLSEETDTKPKPMVLVHDKPILSHLMNIFSVQGFDEFVIAIGYQGDVIKRWITESSQLSGSFSIDFNSGKLAKIGEPEKCDWKVHVIETGLTAQTGGRIKKCLSLFPGERVIVTYGDGLGNIDINKLIRFHESHGGLATVTGVRPPARFGNLHLGDDGLVESFGEKNQSEVGWINGGFFVLEPEVINYIDNLYEPFETGALPRLVSEKQLFSYQHFGYWQPMDTLREKTELSALAQLSTPPWLEGIV